MAYLPKLIGTLTLTDPMDGHGRRRTGHPNMTQGVKMQFGAGAYRDKSCPQVARLGITRCTECVLPVCTFKVKGE